MVFKIVNTYIPSDLRTILLCKHCVIQSLFDVHKYLCIYEGDQMLPLEPQGTSLVKLIGWLTWFFLGDHSSVALHHTHVL
jgi:hypothetical protein